MKPMPTIPTTVISFEQTGFKPSDNPARPRSADFDSPGSLQSASTCHRSVKPAPKRYGQKFSENRRTDQADAKHPLHSLAFGLSMGVLVVFIFLFGFFNQVIIAPFIQPSRHVLNTPLIVSAASVSPTATRKLLSLKLTLRFRFLIRPPATTKMLSKMIGGRGSPLPEHCRSGTKRQCGFLRSFFQ